MKHENLGDEISSQDKNKTETNVSASKPSTLPSSSSREDESTTVQSQTGSTFYIPFCASVFYVMASSGFVCMFAMRASLSVTLVAMINQTAITDDVLTIHITNISNTDQCPRDPAVLHRAEGEFTWDRHQQGALLAAFFCGALITQVCIKNQNPETKALPRIQCTSMATVWLSLPHQERTMYEAMYMEKEHSGEFDISLHSV